MERIDQSAVERLERALKGLLEDQRYKEANCPVAYQALQAAYDSCRSDISISYRAHLYEILSLVCVANDAYREAGYLMLATITAVVTLGAFRDSSHIA